MILSDERSLAPDLYNDSPGVSQRVASFSFFEEITSIRANEPWMADALCTQIGPEGFFPSKGESNEPAKKICRMCEVRSECLQYELRFDARSDDGIWNGTTPEDRVTIRAAMKLGIVVDFNDPDVAELKKILAQTKVFS